MSERQGFTAWLIERHYFGEKPADFLSSVIEHTWTSDALTAVKFDTEQQAHHHIMTARLAGHSGYEGTFVVEHQWVGGPPATPDAPSAPDLAENGFRLATLAEIAAANAPSAPVSGGVDEFDRRLLPSHMEFAAAVLDDVAGRAREQDRAAFSETATFLRHHAQLARNGLAAVSSEGSEMPPAASSREGSPPDENKYFGGDCPVGMVQVEFVGCPPSARRSDYGWKPVPSTFLEVWVDGQRFRIDVGTFHDGHGERRGLHIVTDLGVEFERTSMNAASCFFATPRDLNQGAER